MAPISAMRNSLGKKHGGSGVQIDRDEYNKSVKFWQEYAILKWF